eukprot:CAMPEP_0204256290 /NCGR_PEP_ID=MMETSP0468-20130131/3688_1 /ASSEMBLY_ACC=CAM_ASM_000383 /TAXON_ID=2969 /ORGANISM="Oxyrrhis marina" /LENGTH=282 /DNA_ID=CAMNT_0051230227 /DNA_START=70 /DNA_END=918 /DNA_ORIENTATION=-
MRVIASICVFGSAITIDKDSAAAVVSVAPDGSAELVAANTTEDFNWCKNDSPCKQNCWRMRKVCGEYKALAEHSQCGFISTLCCSDMPSACMFFWGGAADAEAAGLCTASEAQCKKPSCDVENFFLDNFLPANKKKKNCVDLQCTEPSLAQAMIDRSSNAGESEALTKVLDMKDPDADEKDNVMTDVPVDFPMSRAARMAAPMPAAAKVVSAPVAKESGDEEEKEDEDEAEEKEDEDDEEKEKEDYYGSKKEKKSEGKQPKGDVPAGAIGEALLMCFEAVNE